MFPRPGVSLAVLWLQVMDAADVSVGPTNLAQPRAPAHVLSCLRIDPDIIDTLVANRDRVNPCQNIVPPRRIPTEHVRFRCARRKGIAQVEAAIPALSAFEASVRHVIF